MLFLYFAFGSQFLFILTSELTPVRLAISLDLMETFFHESQNGRVYMKCFHVDTRQTTQI